MQAPAIDNVVNISEAASVRSAIAERSGHWFRLFTNDEVHPFDEIKWKIVDAKITDPSGARVVFEQKDVEVPDWWNQNTINVVADKYFRYVNGVKENSIKQVFSRVAKTLKNWAQEQNYFNTDQDAKIFEEELIWALLHQLGAFNSPVWFNLGIPGRRQAASACFISGVDDSLDSIFEFQKSEATIFSGGSGSGANLSKLRSSYEKLSSGSYTTGPLAWMRGLDQYALAMKSGGSTRNAAKMVVLDMDHPDILETRDGRPGFIRCKAAEEKRAHALIASGYSNAYDDPNGAYKNVMYQNANHSVSISDEFMQAVVNDEDWVTRERKSGKPVKVYKARELWNEIAETAWLCADPGVQFNSTMNKWHTTPNSGKINASNPCSEFTHVDNTACNLCALNLTKFFKNQTFDFKKFKQAVRLFVTSQNAIVNKSDYPTEKITENSHKLRPIGLNYGDLGSLIMSFGYSYDSDEGRAIAARMASFMTGLGYQVSGELATRVGPFPDFDKNRDEMLSIMNMHKEANQDIIRRWSLSCDPLGDDVVTKSDEIWEDVIRLGKKFGYTISQASLQAPLGTISFLMGMNTTGIEPAFSLVSYKTLVGGGFMKLTNESVKNGLRALQYSEENTELICKHIEENDCIEGAPNFSDEHLSVFDCAMPSGKSTRYLSSMAHIKMMAAIQPLITCAMSKTVNLPNDATAKNIADLYLESWKLGLKCVSVYRDGCKLSQPLATKGRSDEQLGKVQEVFEDQSVVPKRHRMPEDVDGHRHKFDIDGFRGYIQMNEYPDGTLGEVFLKLGKPGSTVAGLVDGFTKLLSIALQHGVPLRDLIESFINLRFEPDGLTKNKDIRFAKSIYDYLFRYLDLRYLNGEVTGTYPRKESDSDPAMSISKNHESLPPTSGRKSFDGPPCTNCGNLTVRAGSCWICKGCGSSSGCS
jgi:ribonucleoside-diphosphate reductase alpha chain